MRDPSSYRNHETDMFGGDTLVTSHRDRGEGDGWTHDEVEEDLEPHPLDKPEPVAMHARLMGHYGRELEKQSENRLHMAEDEAFYDHEQWSEEEKAILMDRGQVPLVYNVTATAVNWILGSQRRQPLDYAILPRRKDGSKHAERKTDLMKYLSDVNDSPVHVSSAFSEQVKAGLSWLECGVQDDDAAERLYERHESWRYILHDSNAKERDLTDSRYCFRIRWTDTDRAKAMFRDRAQLIEDSAETVFGSSAVSRMGAGDWAMDEGEAASQSVNMLMSGGGDWSASRDRVRLIECWYRVPVESDVMIGGDFSGELHDPRSEGHAVDIEEGRATVQAKMRERVMVAIMCERGMLWNGKSPYRHNRFPFTPCWGVRRASDNLPYGMIRGIRDIQRDVNKRASKMLWHLSAQRVLFEEGSVKSVEELREESQRPDAVIAYKKGYQKPEIAADYNMAAAHGEQMSRGIEMIQQTSGVTDEQMGRATNAQSGRAILARQEQGQLTTSMFFENLAYARKLHGEKILSNIEQFMDEERQFRITGKTGGAQFVTINDDDPDDDNHITRTKANFVVAERDYRATERQAAMQMLMENLTRLAPSSPELIPAIIDLIVEASDIPMRDEIVKRIRAITGQTDPEAEEDPNDPEVQAKAQAQAMMQAMQQRGAEAQIAGAEAKVEESRAKAVKWIADAGYSASRANSYQSEAEQREVDKFRASLEAALVLMQDPTFSMGQAADIIMRAADARAMASGQPSGADQMPPPPGPQEASPLQAQDDAMMPTQPAVL